MERDNRLFHHGMCLGLRDKIAYIVVVVFPLAGEEGLEVKMENIACDIRGDSFPGMEHLGVRRTAYLTGGIARLLGVRRFPRGEEC